MQQHVWYVMSWHLFCILNCDVVHDILFSHNIMFIYLMSIGGPDDDADVYYTIRASIETYMIPNSEGGLPNLNVSSANESVGMLTRTFVGVPEESSPFCNGGDDGSTGALGPCLKVLPGQKVKGMI